jgi:hypothetical protein
MTTLQIIATVFNGLVAVLCVAILIRQRKIMKHWKKHWEEKEGNGSKP